MLTERYFAGDKQISEQEIISFPNGIIGFENYTKFIIETNKNIMQIN